MRPPQWFPDQCALDPILPNIARIRHGAVLFEQHYTAANDCTPARAAMVTGLYGHQTECLLTSQANLPAQFPTWGSMIRDHGYQTSESHPADARQPPDPRLGAALEVAHGPNPREAFR
ncbi:sulfatase-like hydrolase/transferase [Nocardia sp. CA2R105]|nr:sulfatase-like hydrolase/transferase [Nocardia coffeae]